MKNTYLKIYNLLVSKERQETLVLAILMMFGMVLETLGIGLIIPVIAVLMQVDLISNSPFLYSILMFLGKPSQTVLISGAMIFLVSIYLIKNVYLAFLIWKQTNFVYNVQLNLSQRLFTIYLRQPYTFHLQRNSAELIRNVSGSVSVFTELISGVQNIVSELMVLISITILLLIIEPLGTLSAGVILGIAAWGFHRLTRKQISIYGAERQTHDSLRLQHLQQGLGGAKDVKLLGRESDFLAQYYAHNLKTVNASKYQVALQNYPRLMFELLAVIGLAVLVLSMLSQGGDRASIIPTLGLFAAASFRLMPSINRILTSFQTLRYSLPVVNILYEEIMLSTSEHDCQQLYRFRIFKNKLSLSNIKYYYSGTSTPALDGISITISQGETIGIIGESGSGKSTLVDLILGLLSPSVGFIEVDGYDIQQGLRSWQDKIGYVPQTIFLTDDTFRRNIAFGLSEEQIDDTAIKDAIHAAQLDDFISSLPEGIETMVGEHGVRISGGQRQRIGIARALYHNPDVLVLDEATSALDTTTENGVMKAIMALHGKKTILIVAHRLSTVEHCDRIYQLFKGKVVKEGTPTEMITSNKNI